VYQLFIHQLIRIILYTVNKGKQYVGKHLRGLVVTQVS